MSSEDSCSDDEQIEPGPGPKPRKIRRLKWERTKLKNIKNVLDVYIRTTMKPSQRRLSARTLISNVKSDRPMPKGVPSWAGRKETDLDVSLESI